MLALALTESALVHNMDILTPMPHRLRSHGFSLAPDDFGTGPCFSWPMLVDDWLALLRRAQGGPGRPATAAAARWRAIVKPAIRRLPGAH